MVQDDLGWFRMIQDEAYESKSINIGAGFIWLASKLTSESVAKHSFEHVLPTPIMCSTSYIITKRAILEKHGLAILNFHLQVLHSVQQAQATLPLDGRGQSPHCTIGRLAVHNFPASICLIWGYQCLQTPGVSKWWVHDHTITCMYIYICIFMYI